MRTGLFITVAARGLLSLALGAPLLSQQAGAASPPAEVAAEIAGAHLLGEGRLRWFGLHVYDARLWVGPEHPRSGPDRANVARVPLALELEYARALHGAQIAERSIDEIRRGGAPAEALAQRWLASLKACFPDVKAGDRITGVQRPGELTRFFFNGKAACDIADADFTRRFFGIWLDPQTSQPALRSALLGGSR